MWAVMPELPGALEVIKAWGETNSNPKPFVWTADPKRVLAAVKRGKKS
jgi:hypothetical protein